MVMVGPMITVTRTCEACAKRVMLDAQGSRARQLASRCDRAG